MSIDGLIERVTDLRPQEDALLLELCGRMHRYTVENPETGQEELVEYYDKPGQSSLRIVEPSWRPEVGMAIWGGSSSVRIEANPPREYNRIMYHRIQEVSR